MSEVYNCDMQNIIRKCAEKYNIALKEGVYVQISGPNFETSAAVRMYRS